MREHLERLSHWLAEGPAVGLAVVVSTYSSAPLPVGSVMAVSADGEAIGSVSGGCVEGAVYAECVEAAASGRSRRRSYGISDDDAFAVSLTCGGTLEVCVMGLDSSRFAVDRVAELVAADRPAALAFVLTDSGPGRILSVGAEQEWGSTGTAELDVTVIDRLRGDDFLVDTGIHRIATADREVDVFIQTFPPRPRLLVFGATSFAGSLADAGRLLGYRVTVCDARPVFATAERFRSADEVVRCWPHEYLATETAAGRVTRSTAICVLTHDERFDLPLLEAALGRSPAGYIGAMGSRRTHDSRAAALRSAGMSPDVLARLHSPIGLDLNASTPAETAVSILAEIIADRGGASGRRLSDTCGAIHGGGRKPGGGKSTSSPVARSPHSTATTARSAR